MIGLIEHLNMQKCEYGRVLSTVPATERTENVATIPFLSVAVCVVSFNLVVCCLVEFRLAFEWQNARAICVIHRNYSFGIIKGS